MIVIEMFKNLIPSLFN